MISSKHLIVSAVTFRYLIHLNISFAYGVSYRLNFICMSILSYCNTPCLREYTLSLLKGLGILIKDQLTITVWVCLWTFNLITFICRSVLILVLCYLDYYCFVVYFEIRKCESPNFIFCLFIISCWDFFKIPCNSIRSIESALPFLPKKSISGILTEITLNLYIVRLLPS